MWNDIFRNLLDFPSCTELFKLIGLQVTFLPYYHRSHIGQSVIPLSQHDHLRKHKMQIQHLTNSPWHLTMYFLHVIHYSQHPFMLLCDSDT